MFSDEYKVACDASNEDERLLGTSHDDERGAPSGRRQGVYPLHRPTFVCVAISCLTAAFLWGAFVGNRWTTWNKFSTVPAAIERLLHAPTTLQHFNTTLGPTFIKPTPWREKPDPSNEPAWKRIKDTGAILITADDLRRMGKDPSRYVRVPDSFGYGEAAYMATFNHIHLMHCVDALRRAAMSEEPDERPGAYLHLGHCAESIVSHLLCHVTYEVWNWVWLEGQPFPEPEFAYDQQCRSYDDLVAFNNKERKDMDRRIVYLMPPDDAQLFPLDPVVLDFAHQRGRDFEAEGVERLVKFREAVEYTERTGKLSLREPYGV